LNLPMFNLEV